MRYLTSLVVTALAFAPLTWAQQVTGSGTPNQIPRFTSATSIGDSPLVVGNGKVGLGTAQPVATLEVFNARGIESNVDAPYAIMGTGLCPFDNFCGGIRGEAQNYGIGLIGVARGDGKGGGVYGTTFSSSGFAFGARGDAVATTGNAVGLFGASHSPDGFAAQFINYGGGAIFSGVAQSPTSQPKEVFRVDARGRVYASGGFRPFGADFAESMAIVGDRSRYEPGDLLAIDASSARRLTRSSAAYSTLVAGIYSTQPGVLASPYAVDDPSLAKEVPLAVVGIVPCKATAKNGAIEPGDLLVASSTPGHAMKGLDRTRMLGAVVGKALEPLHEGTGVIQVLG